MVQRRRARFFDPHLGGEKKRLDPTQMGISAIRLVAKALINASQTSDHSLLPMAVLVDEIDRVMTNVSRGVMT